MNQSIKIPEDVLAIYPFASHFHSINGHRYHYLDEGEGEAVLMLHGNPTWSFFYRQLVPVLSRGFRVIVPDHMGCGLSDKPDDESYKYTLDQRVKDLESLVDSLGLESFSLVLHDWGGMIGMTYAARHPEKIKRLVLMNTAAFPKPEKKRLPWSIGMCRHKWLGAPLVRGLNAFSRGALQTCTVKPLHPTVKKGYLAPYNNWQHRRAVHRFVQDIPLVQGDESYDDLQFTQDRLELFKDRPALILWGDQDFVFDHHFREEWERRLPQATTKRYAEAGHYILEDVPREVEQEIWQFLQSH